jgi:hypothetical protein
MAKRPNPKLAKIHRTYSVEEVAGLYLVHKNTVRGWIKKGLLVCDDQRPALILGRHLRDFLQVQKQGNKHKCKSYEMYCLRCKSPQRPAENMVDYEPLTSLTGRLIGICGRCEGLIKKYVSKGNLALLDGVLDLMYAEGTKTYRVMILEQIADKWVRRGLYQTPSRAMYALLRGVHD